MYPILFDLPSFPIYSQTILMIAACAAGLAVALREGKRFGFSANMLTDLLLWGFLAALIGARFLLLLIETHSLCFPLDKNHLLRVLNTGSSFHGGLFGASVALAVLARWRRVSIWRLADALSPALAVAMLFMRVGCLLNGCDYGVASSVPWALPLHGEWRHPIQLYEGIGNAALAPWLMRLNRKPLPPGCVAGLYLLLSSVLRVGVDVYRDDPARIWGLTIPQYLALGIALLAAIGLIIRQKHRRVS